MPFKATIEKGRLTPEIEARWNYETWDFFFEDRDIHYNVPGLQVSHPSQLPKAEKLTDTILMSHLRRYCGLDREARMEPTKLDEKARRGLDQVIHGLQTEARKRGFL